MKKPNIIVYDIETFPAEAAVWGNKMWDENLIEILKPYELASFAYKQLGKGNPVVVESREGQKSDKQLIQKLHKVLDNADVIIAHNGDRFDIKKGNTRMVKHGILPYTPGKTIDTLKVAKNNFAFTSNKLDDLAKFLGVKGKMKHSGYSLWKKCREEDDAQSWETMRKYNAVDVLVLEEVYLKLRPWIKNHPNMGILLGINGACPNCGSTQLQSKGYRMTTTGQQKRFRCMGCGKQSHSNLTKKITHITG